MISVWSLTSTCRVTSQANQAMQPGQSRQAVDDFVVRHGAGVRLAREMPRQVPALLRQDVDAIAARRRNRPVHSSRHDGNQHGRRRQADGDKAVRGHAADVGRARPARSAPRRRSQSAMRPRETTPDWRAACQSPLARWKSVAHRSSRNARILTGLRRRRHALDPGLDALRRRDAVPLAVRDS